MHRVDISQVHFAKAGDENRTHMTSLEGWGSTTELHPQNRQFWATPSIDDIYYIILKSKCQALFYYLTKKYLKLVLDFIFFLDFTNTTA